MGRFTGKVAVITGAARGQGRSHAVRLAEEGASIIALDICENIATVRYDLAEPADLEATVKLVEQTGGQIVARQADVRELAQVEAVVAAGLERFGSIDVVCANAAVAGYGPSWELDPADWRNIIDVNLTGVWHTIRACVPSMIKAGNGGSIVITSSTGGIYGIPYGSHYSASKHGVHGLAHSLAQELAPHFIRVNCVNPTCVATDMLQNPDVYGRFAPDKGAAASFSDVEPRLKAMNSLPIAAIDSSDVTSAVLWLASDEARYVTGVSLPVDAGSTQKMPST